MSQLLLDERRLVQVREACALLAISRATLHRRAASDPTFPKGFKSGTRRFWRRADLLAWIDAQAEDAA